MGTKGSPKRDDSMVSSERDETESKDATERDHAESEGSFERDQGDSKGSPERDEPRRNASTATGSSCSGTPGDSDRRADPAGVPARPALQPRFAGLDTSMITVYLVAVSLGTLATFMFVAPVTAHRMLFRRHAKDVLVASGNVLAEAGLICLGLTIVLAVTLVFGFVMGTKVGWWAGAATLGVSVFVWFVLPLLIDKQRRRGRY